MIVIKYSGLMINKLFLILKKITKGESLNDVIIFNVLSSYFFNFISLLIGFVSIPFLLKLLSNNQYGIWITIFSILSWLSIFDFGISQGLRNNIPRLLKSKNNIEFKQLIQSAYLITFLVSIGFLVTTLVLYLFIDFKTVFNLNANPIPENINQLVLLIVFMYCFQFSSNNIVGILHATLESRFITLIDACSKSIMFLGILFLLYFQINSLFFLAVITILSRTLFMWFFTYRFTKKYNLNLNLFEIKDFSKKISNLKNQKPLLFNSFVFFIINISTIFLLNSTNFLITYWFSPAEVIPFSISFKLFSSLLILFYLFLAPFWSAITDAVLKNNMTWIIGILKKMILNYFIFISFVFIIYLISPLIFDIWIGDEVVISKDINFAVFIYLIIMSWNALFAHFLGGINILDLQLKIAIFHILSNIPFCWFLAVYCGFGIVGIIWATNINLLILSVGLPLQSYKFLKIHLNK